MSDKLKNLLHNLIRLQFWTILFLETSIVGGILIYEDFIYEDNLIPGMLITLNFPFFGVIMFLGGIYSIVRLFTRIDLASIIINAVLWAYVAIACVVQLMDPTIKYGTGITCTLLVLSLALCIRILGNAYYLDLSKEKKNSKELIDERME